MEHNNMKTLMAADAAEVWNNIKLEMDPETDCKTCIIITARAKGRSRRPMTAADKPFTFDFLYIMPNAASQSLTPRTFFSHYLLCVRRYSRHPYMHGMRHRTTQDILEGLQAFAVRFGRIDEVGYLYFKRVQSDAGPQFTSGNSSTSLYQQGSDLQSRLRDTKSKTPIVSGHGKQFGPSLTSCCSTLEWDLSTSIMP
ncbi:MAG: hypothetical protein ACREBR_03575 [bacterium]